MFKFLTSVSIVRRLLFAAVLAALIPGIMIIVLGISYLSTLSAVNNSIQQSSNAVQLVTNQEDDLLRMNALISALGTSNDNTQSQNIQITQEVTQLSKDFEHDLTTYQRNYQIVSSPDMAGMRNTLNNSSLRDQVPLSQQSLIFIVNLQWQEYKSYQDIVLNDVNAQHPASAQTLSDHIDDANLRYLPLKGNLDNLSTITNDLSQSIVQASSQHTTTLIWATIVAFLFSTVIVLLIGSVVNQTIVKPLQQLAQLTTRIAQGETNARAHVTGNDEISMVARSINTMLDNIVSLMQTTRQQHDFLQSRVDQLISEVSCIAEGDLRTQTLVTPDTLGILADSFNYMIKELSGLVVRVKTMSHNVENLTTTTLEHMNQLVSIGDRQIQQIEDSEREVEHMADQTRHVTERVRVLQTLAFETRQTAEQGRVAVRLAGAGIERIHENVQSTTEKVKILGESSRQINDMVGVISNVAYQTHRLALDAAVQAAMAGENGKGFAAVASDIRRLSEQTKSQTDIITRLVQTVTENIENVASSIADTRHETDEENALAQQTGAALTSIFDAVDQQAQEIEGITALTTQQLQSSRAVVHSMRSISHATQESNTSTHNASQNMWHLARLVEQLRTSVEAFKLREEQTSYNLPRVVPEGLPGLPRSHKLRKF